MSVSVVTFIELVTATEFRTRDDFLQCKCYY